MLSIVGTLVVLAFLRLGSRDADQALKEAREIGEAGTLMFTLTISTVTQIFCGELHGSNHVL